MEKTKRCPYCGEEILAIAKKCKHCGEWFDEPSTHMSTSTLETEFKDNSATEETASIDDEKTFSQNIPLSNTAIKCLFCVTIIGLAIETAHGFIQDGERLSTSTGAGRTRIIKATLNLLSTIPEWIGEALETFGVIVLLLTIQQAMSNMRQSFDNLFRWIIYATGVSSVLFVLVDFMDDEFAFSFTAFLFLLIEIILVIILGIKISTVYTGLINKLGKVMYIWGGVGLLLFLISICCEMFVEDEGNLYWIQFSFTNVGALVNFYYYLTLMEVLIHSEEE
jgi:hypothetical protein